MTLNRSFPQAAAIVLALASVAMAASRSHGHYRVTPRQSGRARGYSAPRSWGNRQYGATGRYYARRVSYVRRRTYLSRATSTEANLLRRAYSILLQNNQSYQGHRVQAMRAISAAAYMLRVNLRRGVRQQLQPQAAPGAEFLRAQVMLQQAGTSLMGRNLQRPAMKIGAALQHISKALAVM